MSVDDILSELRADLSKYDSAGLIDEISVYRWVEWALRRFGGAIAVTSEAVLPARNGSIDFPSDFFDLLAAYRVYPKVCEIPGGKAELAELQHEIGFIERTERGFRWNSCTECCKEEFEKTITQKIYINSHEVRFHYERPEILYFGRGIRRDCSADKYRDRFDSDKYDLSVVGDKAYCKFDGFVYIIYRATPKDENGLPYIPETQLGYLQDYVETYVKMKIYEKVAANGEMQGAADMYKLYFQQEPSKFARAMKEAKMSQFSLDDYREIAEDNRRERMRYEAMWPQKYLQFVKFV